MRLVALIGSPVAQSLSPRMQDAAFAARGLDWTYVACDVAPRELDAAIRGLDALGADTRPNAHRPEYPDSATAAAARDAGVCVLDGLEVLVAQGAASFELWTGVSAPVEAMRRALGLARAHYKEGLEFLTGE